METTLSLIGQVLKSIRKPLHEKRARLEERRMEKVWTEVDRLSSQVTIMFLTLDLDHTNLTYSKTLSKTYPYIFDE